VQYCQWKWLWPQNVKGFGITTNHKLISEIQGNKIEDIVSNYLKVTHVEITSLDLHSPQPSESSVANFSTWLVLGLAISQNRGHTTELGISEIETVEGEANIKKIQKHHKRCKRITKRTYIVIDWNHLPDDFRIRITDDLGVQKKKHVNRFCPWNESGLAKISRRRTAKRDRARFVFKKFTTFKNSFDLKDDFKMYVSEPRVSLNKILPEKTESKTEEQKQNNEAKAIAHGRSKRKISNEAKPRTENDSRNVLKYQAMIASNLLNKYYPNNQDYQSLDELYKRLSLSWPLKILSQVTDTEPASHIENRLPLLKA
jgi:hypothetical protein